MDLTWKIKNRILGFTSNDSDFNEVDSVSIFKDAFRDTPVFISGCQLPRVTKYFPEITFSKFGLDPRTYIYTKEACIYIDLVVQVDSQCYSINKIVDQILIENTWYPIKKNSIEELLTTLEINQIKIGSKLSLGNLLNARRLAAELALIDEVELSSPENLNLVQKQVTRIDGLIAEPYEYQKAGISYLNMVSDEGVGCILGDDMGLGKTLQIIALLQLEKNKGRQGSLVIAPATLLENWRREISSFAPLLSVYVHAGMHRAGVSDGLDTLDVVLVSYETAIRDEPILSQIAWNILVLDEAQNIKNPLAKRTKVIKSLPRRVSIAVTGTPFENRSEDLWSLADFAVYGLLGDIESFSKRYSDDEEGAEMLAPLISPIMLRRLVEHVAKDLPEKIEIPQAISVSRKFAESYENLRLRTLEEYGKAANMVATTRLRMLCVHPSLITGTYSLYDTEKDFPKYEHTMELMNEIFSKKEKLLIFTTYQKMVDIFMRDSITRWPEGYFNFIDGRVEVSRRQEVVDEFFNYSEIGALFLNPKAAGSGLNITAANHVIHYNPEWNPALTEQASRRSYRRKQEKPVTIHHLYYADTVEEVIFERAGYKRTIADLAVQGNDGSVTKDILQEALTITPLKS